MTSDIVGLTVEQIILRSGVPVPNSEGRGRVAAGAAQPCSDTEGHSRARARHAHLGAQVCGFHPHASGKCVRQVTMSLRQGARKAHEGNARGEGS